MADEYRGEESEGVRASPRLQAVDPLALLESLVRALPDAVTATDLEGRVIIASRRTAELHGCESEEEILGMDALDLIAPEEHERAMENLRATLERGMVGPVAYEMLRKDGSRFRGELTATVVLDAAGAPSAFVAAVRDVTERERGERALRESEERYRNLVDLLPDPVVVLQEDRCQFVSSAFTRLFGYTQADVDAGLSFYDLVPEQDKARVRERYAQRLAGEAVGRTYRIDLIAKDGNVVRCETSAVLIQHEGRPADLVIVRDVSEREQALKRQRELEAEIQQSQKVESLGLLAGGVAHDFNNLLVGVLAHAGLARRALPRNAAVRSNIDMIETAAHRAAELCDQLLAYSGREQPDLTQVDLTSVASEILGLLHVPLAKKARLEADLAPSLPTIAGDPTQLRQLLMNLIQNAADATSLPGGRVVVRTGIEDCDEAFIERHGLRPDMRPGMHVFVEVRDNGCGMGAETAAQIFEPFFTTKRSGRGLGLAAVRGFVNAHGGAIRVQSEPGEGSRFCVYFPALDALGGGADAQSEDRAQTGLTGTVLVVDDEAMVRTVVEDVLTDAGLNVLAAADGQEALAIFGRCAGEISAVIVDINMPGMGGEELLKRLEELDPEVRVLLSSGILSERAAKLVASDPRVRFIAKPFDLDALIATLQQILG